MQEHKEIVTAFICALVLLFACGEAHSYTAMCYPEYGSHFSESTAKPFEISVENGVLTRSYNSIEPATSHGKWGRVKHYTKTVRRSSQYKFRNKGKDVFCYEHGYNGYDQTFEQMLAWGMICLGKFDNNIFPYIWDTSETWEHGRCVLENAASLPHASDEVGLSEKAMSNGFIAASAGPMSYENASQWCEARGGRLPKINGSDSLDYYRTPIVKVDKIMENASAEGFGKAGGQWADVGLPHPVRYWSGTEIPTREPIPENFVIQGIGDVVMRYYYPKNALFRAACVKKDIKKTAPQKEEPKKTAKKRH